MSFPRYPKYKPSGIEWLGEVPEHWHVAPLKRVATRIESGTSVNATDEQAEPGWPGVLKTSCVYTGQFDPREHKRVIPEETSDVSCPVRRGCLIVSRMNTSELVAAVGWVKHEPRDLYLPDRLWQVDIASPDVGFVHYWTLTGGYRSQVEAACTGTSSSMKNLSQDQFLGFTLPCPPSWEARSIAAFLDRETAKIDALIAEQEKLIELLAEKRQAVISHAVTKGLNPAAPMKPSGVEWLGDVPAHWEVKRLKHFARAITGLTYDPAEIVDNEAGTLVLRSSNVQEGAISLDDTVHVTTTIPSELRTKKGDILVCSRNGSRDLIGKNAVIDSSSEGLTWGAFMTVVRSDNSRHLRWILNSSLFTFQSGRFLTATINQLTVETLENFEVPLPPRPEAEAIASFIEHETGRLGALTDSARQAVTLLRERRSALISAAVTGQIDVRNAVPENAA